jgi:ADP-ribosylglycohydrolase
MLQRALGCVIGAFVGDAAGATLEFIGQRKINDFSVT